MELASYIDALKPHQVSVLAGVDATGLTDALAVAAAPSRPVMSIELSGLDVAAMRASALSHAQAAALSLWPAGCWGGEDFSDLRADPLSLAHLPLRLEALCGRVAGVSRAWARRAVEALLRGGLPGDLGAPVFGWEQLVLMLAPAGLILVLPRRPAPSDAAFVATAEWLAGDANVAVVVLTPTPPAGAAWERMHHEIVPAPPAAAVIDVAPPAALPLLLAGPVFAGRPAPHSAAEQRLYRALRDDEALAPLFGFNLTVTDIPLMNPRIDVLCRARRVAVEVDGPEHRGPLAYRADRERDYRLMCAGYHVLRLTNEEIFEDCARAVDKVKQVVALAQRRQA